MLELIRMGSQSSIAFPNLYKLNLGKKFLRISSIRKSTVTWILARGFAYLPSFFSQILDFMYWTVLIFRNGVTLKTSNSSHAWESNILELTLSVWSGAIIGDGDRTFWDRRAPMIWDTFAIFRTNFATLTSYIRVDPRTCRGFSSGCCHVAWSICESSGISYGFFTAMAANKAVNENQGSSIYFYALS